MSESSGVVPQLSPREEIERTFEVFHGRTPEEYAELLILMPDKSPGAGCFKISHEFSRNALSMDIKGGRNIYISLNPVKPREGMARERLADTHDTGISRDEDVLRLRWLFIDFDPKREANTSSTDEEKAQAETLMREVKDYLAQLGWPEPVVADSGNGAHLPYRIDLPNDEESRALVKATLGVIADRFTTSAVEIDRSVSNASRHTRLYGTINRKGPNTPERPWRRSRILSAPAEPVPVTAQQLQEIVSEAKGASRNAVLAGAPPTAAGGVEEPAPLALAGSGASPRRKRFKMERFLKYVGIKARGPIEYNQGVKFILVECPFNPSHNRGEAAVFVDASGAPGFN
jgi:hypothetical protein